MRSSLLALLVAGWLGSGCYLFHEREAPGAEPVGSTDFAECDPVTVAEDPSAPQVDVDLLFMVDNSNSMSEEQESLAAELPRLVEVLVTGDLEGDGRREFTPVRSLHLGVVTSDMGTGGFLVPTCTEPDFGDDGVLVTRGGSGAGCAESYPTFLEWRTDGVAAPGELAGDFACLAAMGTGGCGFEQQLEATLKALTPSSSDLRFERGTTGHGDGANAGFVRPDSVLGVLLLTDEEDCSAEDSELFNPSSSIYSGNLNLRCFSYPGALHPVERYVDGLAALRRDRPESLVVAAITGVPADLVSDPDRIDYDAVLSDPRMQEVVDFTDGNRLMPSCNTPGRGIAFPPRRIVRTVQAFGDRGIVQSICQEDFSPAIRGITERLATAIRRTSCRD